MRQDEEYLTNMLKETVHFQNESKKYRDMVEFYVKNKPYNINEEIISIMATISNSVQAIAQDMNTVSRSISEFNTDLEFCEQLKIRMMEISVLYDIVKSKIEKKPIAVN